MGCYNVICAASGLPITWSDKVVVLIVTKNRHYKSLKPNDNMFEPFDLWEPLGMPFYAKYNDYGWVEEVEENYLLDFTMSQIGNLLVPRDLGKNQCHDHETKKELLDLDSLGEWFHGDRLHIQNEYGGWPDSEPVLPAYYVMIRADVYKKLVDISKVGYWDNSNKRIVCNVSSLSKNLKNEWDSRFEARIKIKTIKGDDPSFNDVFRIAYPHREGFEREFNRQFKILEEPSQDNYDLFYEEVAKLILFRSALSRIRKVLTPQLYGSQDTQLDFYTKYIDIIEDEIQTLKSKYEE